MEGVSGFIYLFIIIIIIIALGKIKDISSKSVYQHYLL